MFELELLGSRRLRSSSLQDYTAHNGRSSSSQGSTWLPNNMTEDMLCSFIQWKVVEVVVMFILLLVHPDLLIIPNWGITVYEGYSNNGRCMLEEPFYRKGRAI